MFKKFIVTALMCMSLPVTAEPLQGRIDYNDQQLSYQFPKVDSEESIDWADWHHKFLLEIRRKLLTKAGMGFPIKGKIRIMGEVFRDGRIIQEVCMDNSTNLALLVPNILDDMQQTDIVTFPAGSQREKVALDVTISIGSHDQLDYLHEKEYVRNDQKTANNDRKTSHN